MPVFGDVLRKGLSIIADEEPRFRSRFAGVSTVAGSKVAPSGGMTAAAVYSATSLLAQTVAELPIDFLRRDDEMRRPVRPVQLRAFWDRPNPDQTRIAFYESLVLSMLLWGNFYGFMRRNRAGHVVEVWPVDPDLVVEIERIELDNGQLGLRFRVEDYGWVENRPGEPPEMLHVPWMTMPGRIKGMSPIEFHAELIGMSLSAQEHAARFLGEGTHVSGVIEAPDISTEDQARELWNNWQLQHAGPKKSGRVGVLTGNAKFNSIAIPPAELQFLEQMKYSDQKIASIYRVPPHMVGDVERSTSWGTGISEQTRGFLQFSLLPIIRRIEEAVESLPGGDGLQMKFNVNGLLRAVATDRGEFYTSMFNIGALSQDEMRAFEDLPPLPGGLGSRYYVPLNIRAVDEEVDE